MKWARWKLWLTGRADKRWCVVPPDEQGHWWWAQNPVAWIRDERKDFHAR